MKDIVTNITSEALGNKPSEIEQIEGKGKRNFVFKIKVDNSYFILRITNNQDRKGLYEIEKWCYEKVKDLGIKIPEIIKTGEINDWAYSIQQYIDGVHGTDSSLDDNKIWFILGTYAKEIHKISAEEIAMDFKIKLDELFNDSFYLDKKIFSEEILNKLKNRLYEILEWDYKPMLNHYNLNPGNTIVDKNNDVWLIDWETANGNRVPHLELAEVFMWKNRKQATQSFITGYGLSQEEFDYMMRDIQTLMLMKQMDAIKIFCPKDGSWEDDRKASKLISGVTDLKDVNKDILFDRNL